MGKFVIYILGILAILFLLEWFRLVDIPYLEIPNYTGSKKELYEKSPGSLND